MGTRTVRPFSQTVTNFYADIKPAYHTRLNLVMVAPPSRTCSVFT